MEEFNGVWAIVTTAGGQFIGEINSTPDHESWDENEVMEEIRVNDWIFMKPVYEFTILMGQGPHGFVRSPKGFPVSICMRDVGKWIKPTGITFFSDMEVSDQNTHKSLVEETRKSIMVSRAQAAGLHTGGPVPDTGMSGSGGMRGPIGRG